MTDPTVFDSSQQLVSVHAQPTFFSLPAELRNEIYRLVLDLRREHVPIRHPGMPIEELQGNWRAIKHNVDTSQVPPPPGIINARLNENFSLLQASSLFYSEARGLMARETGAYIPIVQGISYSAGETRFPGTGNTIFRALEDFMNVHFHVHVKRYPDKRNTAGREGKNEDEDEDEDDDESLNRADPLLLLEVLRIFISYSQEVSKGHRWTRRRAVVHLDDYISVWSCSVGAYSDLVALLASDINTTWEIRFYMPAEATRLEIDLTQLKWYCKDHDHVTVKGEIQGDGELELDEELSQHVTRKITPRANIWVQHKIEDPKTAIHGPEQRALWNGLP